MNVFEAVRVKGKLFAKNVNTGEFAAEGLIRQVVLRAAESNREVMMVGANGRVTRVAAATAGVAVASNPNAGKMSFMSVVESRNPVEMFGNLERLTKMVGRGVQPSLVITGMAGVGKTHLANTLHKYIFGSENSLVRIDCGEFQHKHENQKLIGSPPGYIGHEEGGQLVNLVRKYPSTVVLLDEVEKAHQDLWNTFLRVFDDGMLTDNKGKSVSFRNTIIIMTTNLGNDKISDDLLKTSAGFTGRVDFSSKTKEIPKKDIVEKNTLEAVRKHFKPEFLNRLDKILVFNHLSRENLIGIAELEMSVVKNKLLTKGYSVIYTDSVIDAMLDRGIDSVKGARGLSQVRREMIEDKVADIIINTPPPRGTIFHLNYEDDLVLNLNKPKKERKNDVKEQ